MEAFLIHVLGSFVTIFLMTVLNVFPPKLLVERWLPPETDRWGHDSNASARDILTFVGWIVSGILVLLGWLGFIGLLCLILGFLVFKGAQYLRDFTIQKVDNRSKKG